MSLTEPRTENSGYVQGRMFHRQKVPREPKTIGSEYLTWRDLRVGEDITLFGRKYRIVACNEFTKNFLQDRGISVQEVEGMPIDSWNIRNHFGRRPTGQDANVKIQEEENLRHWETMPGTMIFHVAWLDTKNDFHGARLKRTFRMLANKDDDSVTLIETTPGFNNALFLKDAQLPYMSNDGVRRCYRVANFRPGLWIEVYKRPMYIYDVEGEATRAYMTQYYGPINFGHCSIRLLEDGPPPNQIEILPDQLIFTAENVSGWNPLATAYTNENVTYMTLFQPEFPRTKFLLFYHLNARRADIYEEGRLREWSKGRPFLLDIDVSHLTEKDFMPGSRITLFRWAFILGDAHPRTSDYLKFKHTALHEE
ncbi:Protein Y49A10A.1 [Aphelenchoides avenae]|nr:Protein Y49A10A.1 [Aphelenchus avenae]